MTDSSDFSPDVDLLGMYYSTVFVPGQHNGQHACPPQKYLYLYIFGANEVKITPETEDWWDSLR